MYVLLSFAGIPPCNICEVVTSYHTCLLRVNRFDILKKRCEIYDEQSRFNADDTTGHWPYEV